MTKKKLEECECEDGGEVDVTLTLTSHHTRKGERFNIIETCICKSCHKLVYKGIVARNLHPNSQAVLDFKFNRIKGV